MVTIFEAAAACGAEGGELPSTISLIAFGHEPGTQESIEGEWTKDISLENPGVYNPVIVSEPDFVSTSSLTKPHHYRCVTPLLG